MSATKGPWVQSDWAVRGVGGSVASCETRSDAALIVEMRAALVELGKARATDPAGIGGLVGHARVSLAVEKIAALADRLAAAEENEQLRARDIAAYDALVAYGKEIATLRAGLREATDLIEKAVLGAYCDDESIVDIARLRALEQGVRVRDGGQGYVNIRAWPGSSEWSMTIERARELYRKLRDFVGDEECAALRAKLAEVERARDAALVTRNLESNPSLQQAWEERDAARAEAERLRALAAEAIDGWERMHKFWHLGQGGPRSGGSKTDGYSIARLRSALEPSP